MSSAVQSRFNSTYNVDLPVSPKKQEEVKFEKLTDPKKKEDEIEKKF